MENLQDERELEALRRFLSPLAMYSPLRLKAGEKLMLLVLAHMSEGTPDNPYVNTTLSVIAKKTSCGRITAHKYINTLEEAGAVRKENQYKNGGCTGMKIFLNVDVISTGKVATGKKKEGENV